MSQQELISDALKNVLKRCKSQATKISYKEAIDGYMKWKGIPKGDYDALLDGDPKAIQTSIINYVEDFGKDHAPSSVAHHVSAIQKFYTHHDIILNWKKIKDYIPEDGSVAEDRPYNHSEIKQMIEASSLRNKAIILLMSSTGMRVGAVPSLRVKDIEPIEEYNILKINVYAYPKTRKTYFTFCTPECATVLNEYIEYRKRFGERVTENSPLFRLDFNAADPTSQSMEVKPITRKSIQQSMFYLWRELGYSQLQLEGQQHKRNHIMKCHGFRKFFETNAHKAGMDHIYIRRLLGQKAGLEDSYLKIPERDILDGDDRHVGYIGVMDQLTISEENRLRREVQTYKIRADKVDDMFERIEVLEKQLQEKIK